MLSILILVSWIGMFFHRVEYPGRGAHYGWGWPYCFVLEVLGTPGREYLLGPFLADLVLALIVSLGLGVAVEKFLFVPVWRRHYFKHLRSISPRWEDLQVPVDEPLVEDKD